MLKDEVRKVADLEAIFYDPDDIFQWENCIDETRILRIKSVDLCDYYDVGICRTEKYLPKDCVETYAYICNGIKQYNGTYEGKIKISTPINYSNWGGGWTHDFLIGGETKIVEHPAEYKKVWKGYKCSDCGLYKSSDINTVINKYGGKLKS